MATTVSNGQPPTFADMTLLGQDNAPCSGTAFDLQDPAGESEIVEIDGWEAQVVEGRRVIVARGGSETSHDDAFRAGLAIAQRALDLMSMRGSNNLIIKAFEDEHLTWWVEGGDVVIRVSTRALIGIDVGHVTLTVRDANGNVVPPNPTPPVMWHESFRYFRLSQTTDDLFDAYRNAYLALESVLSSIAPQRMRPNGNAAEGEGKWFKRALNEANQIVPLAQFATAGSPDPVQDLYDDLYLGMRNAMSHAKSGRKVLLPQDEAERAAVTANLGRLVRVYLSLAETHLGARRLGGGMYAIAFRGAMSDDLLRMVVYASDDESPVTKGELVPNPAGGRIKDLLPVGGVETPSSFVVTRVWSAPCTDLADLPFVRRVVSTIDDTPTLIALLEGRLVLGSAVRLEVMMGVRGSNTRQPRVRYAY